MLWIRRLNDVVGGLFVLSAILFVTWLALCDQASRLPTLPPGEEVVLIGRATGVVSSQGIEYASTFDLLDPTGRVRVLVRDRPPEEGALVIVWARRLAAAGAMQQVSETRRIDTF